MKALLIYLLKFGLRILYAPMKLFKTKENRLSFSSKQRKKSRYVHARKSYCTAGFTG